MLIIELQAFGIVSVFSRAECEMHWLFAYIDNPDFIKAWEVKQAESHLWHQGSAREHHYILY